MAEKLGNEEVVQIDEVVLAQSYQMAALITLLEKKGVLSREEVLEEINALRKNDHS